jgi:hypothetical protein
MDHNTINTIITIIFSLIVVVPFFIMIHQEGTSKKKEKSKKDEILKEIENQKDLKQKELLIISLLNSIENQKNSYSSDESLPKEHEIVEILKKGNIKDTEKILESIAKLGNRASCLMLVYIYIKIPHIKKSLLHSFQIYKNRLSPIIDQMLISDDIDNMLKYNIIKIQCYTDKQDIQSPYFYDTICFDYENLFDNLIEGNQNDQKESVKIISKIRLSIFFEFLNELICKFYQSNIVNQHGINIWKQVINVLLNNGEHRIIKAIVYPLKHDNKNELPVELKIYIIENLECINDSASIKELINLLKDKDISVRSKILYFLIKSNAIEAFMPIKELLNTSLEEMKSFSDQELIEIANEKNQVDFSEIIEAVNKIIEKRGGLKVLEAKLYNEQEEKSEQEIIINDNNALELCIQAFQFREDKKFEMAELAFMEAIYLSSNPYIIKYYLATFYMEQKKYASALKTVSETRGFINCKKILTELNLVGYGPRRIIRDKVYIKHTYNVFYEPIDTFYSIFPEHFIVNNEENAETLITLSWKTSNIALYSNFATKGVIVTCEVTIFDKLTSGYKYNEIFESKKPPRRIQYYHGGKIPEYAHGELPTKKIIKCLKKLLNNSLK